MSADESAGLLFIALAIGILVGGVVATLVAHHRVETAKRHARIAAEIAYKTSRLAYKTAVELELAERDLWVMDGAR